MRKTFSLLLGILKFTWQAFERYYPTFFAALFILVAMGSIMVAYGEFGARESVDSIVQIIGFTFVLATLMLTVNSNAFLAGQQQAVSRIGCLFVIAGVLMLLGLGMGVIGLKNDADTVNAFLKPVGLGVYGFAMFILCFGIAEMGRLALRRLFGGYLKEASDQS
ncbi:MAG: hypothetical protein PHZ00_01975 [Candidatus Peribacteraceae bacterium]|nr:hypothetical protein [Candidatus Peribacteraceae bacterium]